MDDKTMLELAARAAGIDHWYGKEGTVDWNPLHDDAAALRLAVTLNMDVSISGGQGAARGELGSGNYMIEVDGSDPCAATRRAIVRAAAEIGKAMGRG